MATRHHSAEAEEGCEGGVACVSLLVPLVQSQRLVSVEEVAVHVLRHLLERSPGIGESHLQVRVLRLELSSVCRLDFRSRVRDEAVDMERLGDISVVLEVLVVFKRFSRSFFLQNLGYFAASQEAGSRVLAPTEFEFVHARSLWCTAHNI